MEVRTTATVRGNVDSRVDMVASKRLHRSRRWRPLAVSAWLGMGAVTVGFGCHVGRGWGSPLRDTGPRRLGLRLPTAVPIGLPQTEVLELPGSRVRGGVWFRCVFCGIRTAGSLSPESVGAAMDAMRLHRRRCGRVHRRAVVWKAVLQRLSGAGAASGAQGVGEESSRHNIVVDGASGRGHPVVVHRRWHGRASR